MSGLLDSLSTFVYHFVPDVQTCQVLGATNKNPGGLGPLAVRNLKSLILGIRNPC